PCGLPSRSAKRWRDKSDLALRLLIFFIGTNHSLAAFPRLCVKLIAEVPLSLESFAIWPSTKISHLPTARLLAGPSIDLRHRDCDPNEPTDDFRMLASKREIMLVEHADRRHGFPPSQPNDHALKQSRSHRCGSSRA